MIYLMILLGLAVYYDIRYFRIPNSLIGIGMITGIIYQFVYGTVAFSDVLLGMLIPVVILFLLFYLHMLGAGDIKLLSMTGIFLGTSMFAVIWQSFVIAAVISFFQLIIQKNFRSRISYFIGYCMNALKTGKVPPYYQPEQDQYKNAMHFSIGVFGAVILHYL
ncbi:MAG: prepilin peptidase [Lachnospiraceae bacterium]|nr:prepilin peptidase [Lachnospiraceae bacterium]